MADSGQAAGPPVPLQDGEQVILDLHPSKGWTAPIYVGTLGLWEFWRRRHHFVLTNQRIVIAKGILSKQERAPGFQVRMPSVEGERESTS